MRLGYTPRARDLAAISAYIHTSSPQGALNVRSAIRSAALTLDPRRGQNTDALDVRRLPVVTYRYAIYFRAVGDEFQIVQIHHTSRQLPEVSTL